MLEKPALPDESLCACLREEFGLAVDTIEFLPLGADRNTAVYRAIAGGKTYFVKLRHGSFNELSVRLPQFLGQNRVPHVMLPIPGRNEQPWTELDSYKVIVYPFIEGHDGYQVGLTDQQWIAFGNMLRRVHNLELTPDLRSRIRREAFSDRWRRRLRECLALVESRSFADPVARELAEFIRPRRAEILDLLERAGSLARSLHERPPEFVLCHADVHAGNLLITESGDFYLVDWDEAILAPRERDLMSIGAALFGSWRSPAEEEALFYRGYGSIQVDRQSLAYYRYERIIDDLAVECELILLCGEGGADRARELEFFKSNFEPGNTIELAYQSDPMQ